MKTKWMGMVLCTLLLAACTPSSNAVNTAIAQTQAANPTATPTLTPLPTATAVPSATVTPSPSPSPTPDLRIIQVVPEELLLQKVELPRLGKYSLPGPDWTSPSHNEEVVAIRTVEDGRKYLQETGRIDGWWIAFRRGTDGVSMPEEIYNAVVAFETAQGAQVLLNKYLLHDMYKNGYGELGNIPKVGDAARMFTKKEMQSGGNNRMWLLLAFTYRNYYNEIEIWGWESDIDQALVHELSELQWKKFQEAPITSAD